jgi:Polyketide cyclase / dehydrase and lipid transport
MSSPIRYPPPYAPNRTRVYVSNHLEMAAPCERVWAWLVRAPLWPSWYPNAVGVRIESPAGATDLALGTRFHWKTFGIWIDSVVEECVAGERIAWSARAPGVDAYHAWLLTPAGRSCHVLTEETQNGWLAALTNFVMPNRMHTHHQIWLERLRDKSAGGLPAAGV